jgi:hypothetical protein
MLTVIAVRLRLSPVFIVTLADSVTAAWKLPAVLASHPLIAVTVSPLVPAHEFHDGSVPFADTLAPDAVAHVVAGRVVTDETFAVPADPGAPLWSCVFVQLATAVVHIAVALAVDIPSAMSALRRNVDRLRDHLLAARAALSGPVRYPVAQNLLARSAAPGARVAAGVVPALGQDRAAAAALRLLVRRHHARVGPAVLAVLAVVTDVDNRHLQPF